MVEFGQALLIALLLASPQLWHSLRYYPKSLRYRQTFEQKSEVGNISLWRQLRQAIHPTTAPVDGVFGTEACPFIGLPAFLLVPFAPPSIWWLVLVVSISLSLGRRFPFFYRTHWLHLRIPARYTYFTALSLAMLSISAFDRLTTTQQSLVLLMQAFSLIMVSSRLWPMQPYCQRWERPEASFTHPLAVFLAGKPGRVSGLSYPLRTGQVNRIRTLGYAGASGPQAMRNIRRGTHDWFLEDEDGQRLDAYGVMYAYTYRSLQGKWQPTAIPHLYQNLVLSS